MGSHLALPLCALQCPSGALAEGPPLALPPEPFPFTCPVPRSACMRVIQWFETGSEARPPERPGQLHSWASYPIALGFRFPICTLTLIILAMASEFLRSEWMNAYKTLRTLPGMW